MKLRITTACCVLSAMLGCGDDEQPSRPSLTDSGTDAGPSETPRGGRGGSSGKGGAGGAKSMGGSGGSASEQDDAGGADLESVTIRFKAKFGERDLHCGENYTLRSLGSARVTPVDFRIFVQEVHLVTESGDEAPVAFDVRAPVQTREVALIDFTNDAGQCASGTTAENTTITGKVAPGTYRGVRIVTGVPERVNHLDLVEAGPPLNDATTHWGWTNGYRFILSGISVDGVDVADADGGAPTSGTSFVHVGAGGCSGSTTAGFTCARPNRSHVALDGFDPEKNVLVADLARVFAGVDLSKPIECHGPSSPACGPAYTALGLNANDGSARDTQDVFRVE